MNDNVLSYGDESENLRLYDYTLKSFHYNNESER